MNLKTRVLFTILWMFCSFLGSSQTTPYFTNATGNSIFTTNYYPYPLNISDKVVAQADFNEDGIPDVAMGGGWGGNFGIYYGNCSNFLEGNPDTFSIAAIGYVTFVGAADFNHDLHQDFIITGTDVNSFYIYYGDGTGDFPNMSSFVIDSLITPGNYGFSGSIADFNSDSFPDIALSLSIGSGLYLFYGTGSGFLSQPSLQGSYKNYAVDVNGDSLPDLVSIMFNSIKVNINNAGVFSQLLTFSTPVTFTKFCFLKNLAGNGLRYYASGGDKIYIGQVDTIAFASTFNYTLPSDILSFDTGDFDGDSLADDVVVSLDTTIHNIVFFKGYFTGGLTTMPLYYETYKGRVETIDVNQNGLHEFLLCGNNNTTPTITLYKNYGNFRFTTLANYEYGNLVHERISSADFNADGFEDVAVLNQQDGVTFFYGSACGLKNIRFMSVPVIPNSMVAGKFNADTLPDIAVGTAFDTLYVYMNTGTGLFLPPQKYYTGHHINELLTGDFNEDGTDDIATLYCAGSFAATFQYNLSTGTGTFTASPIQWATQNGISIIAKNMVTGDMDNDGHTDVLIANNGQNKSYSILYNDGTGNFPPTSIVTGQLTTYSVFNLPCDFNFDGHTDIINLNVLTDRLEYYYWSTANGNWVGSPFFISVPSGVRSIQTNDLNADSLPDKILTEGTSGQTTSIRIYMERPDGTDTLITGLVAGGDAIRAESNDLNQDGKPDIIVGAETNGMYIYYNQLPLGPILLYTNDTLTAAPSGIIQPYSYQWYSNHTLIPGATQAYLPNPSNGLYWVVVYASNGYFATNKILLNSVAIEEISFDPIRIYPDPVHDIVNFSATNASFIYSIKDMQGNVVAEGIKKPQTTRIDVSKLTAGCYLITFQNDKQIKTIKLVKK